MSEVETIGQRMGERLLASRLFSSVEVELHEEEKSLVLVLSPHRLYSPWYERAMRFCLNFHANQESSAQKNTVFIWCNAFVEDISPNHTCRVWIDCKSPCGYMGFDVLCELITLGLTLSPPLSSASHPHQVEHLTQIYRKKEDVLTSYARFVAHVIQSNDDLPTEECDASLHTLWLCCPKHRFLFVRRILLNRWLHHLFWNLEAGASETDDEELEEDYLLAAPPVEDINRLLSDILQQAFTPQQWLQTRVAHEAHVEELHWDRPTQHCQRKHYIGWACCPLHTALAGLRYLFDQWLEYFDTLYHMREMADKQGRISRLSSVNGLALFIHLAQLDTDNLTFPQGYENIPSVNIQQFYRRQNDDTNDREQSRQQGITNKQSKRKHTKRENII